MMWFPELQYFFGRISVPAWCVLGFWIILLIVYFYVQRPYPDERKRKTWQ